MKGDVQTKVQHPNFGIALHNDILLEVVAQIGSGVVGVAYDAYEFDHLYNTERFTRYIVKMSSKLNKSTTALVAPASFTGQRDYIRRFQGVSVLVTVT